MADTRADLTAATNFVRSTFRMPPLPPEEVYPLVGEGARRLVERALGAQEREAIDAALERFLDYYEAHLLDATVLYPGIAQALEQITASGVILSVLTNKPERLSRRILQGLGVEGRFQALVGGDSLPTRKPDPGGVTALRSRFATAAARFLLVGDSTVDYATAANARVTFCGVVWGFGPHALRAARPRWLAADAAALVEFVTRGARE